MTHSTSGPNSSYSRRVVREFLTLYREKDCLWNKKVHGYKNLRLRGQAFEELMLILQKDFPAATIDDVKQKIDNLRTTYRRQLKEWIKSSAPDYKGHVIEPSVWYFPLLTFLDEDEIPDLAGYQIKTEFSTDENNEDDDKRANEVHESEPNAANKDDTDNEVENSDGEPDATGDHDINAHNNYESRQRRVMREVLLQYREHSCLWKVDHPHYTSKGARKAAWSVLFNTYKKYDKHINLGQLKKKIENFRTSYRRQLKRMIQRNSKGVFEYPSLWYFNLLFFLDKHKYPDIECSDERSAEVENMSSNQSPAYLEEWVDEEVEAYKDERKDVEASPSHTDDDNPLNSSDIETAFSIINKNEQISDQETLQFRKFKRFLKSKESPEANPYVERRKRTREKDRFDLAGQNIACKLRSLDVEQRIRAEKLINDVLFYAEMKHLGDESDLVVSKAVVKN